MGWPVILLEKENTRHFEPEAKKYPAADIYGSLVAPDPGCGNDQWQGGRL